MAGASAGASGRRGAGGEAMSITACRRCGGEGVRRRRPIHGPFGGFSGIAALTIVTTLAACAGQGRPAERAAAATDTASAGAPAASPGTERTEAGAGSTPDSAVIRAAEAFVSDFVAERIPEAWGRVTEELAARSSEQRLGFIRVSIVGSLGAHRSIGTPRYGGTEAGRHTIVVPLEFEKGRLSARIRVTDDGRIAGFAFVPEDAAASWRRPSYASPDAIREEAVNVVREGEAPLSGTLTTPAGTGPFPAVLLLQGAGPANRDAGFGAILPFRDLAYGLA